jgi:hypothetical protein
MFYETLVIKNCEKIQFMVFFNCDCFSYKWQENTNPNLLIQKYLFTKEVKNAGRGQNVTRVQNFDSDYIIMS